MKLNTIVKIILYIQFKGTGDLTWCTAAAKLAESMAVDNKYTPTTATATTTTTTTTIKTTITTKKYQYPVWWQWLNYDCSNAGGILIDTIANVTKGINGVNLNTGSGSTSNNEPANCLIFCDANSNCGYFVYKYKYYYDSTFL